MDHTATIFVSMNRKANLLIERDSYLKIPGHLRGGISCYWRLLEMEILNHVYSIISLKALKNNIIVLVDSSSIKL